MQIVEYAEFGGMIPPDLCFEQATVVLSTFARVYLKISRDGVYRYVIDMQSSRWLGLDGEPSLSTAVK